MRDVTKGFEAAIRCWKKCDWDRQACLEVCVKRLSRSREVAPSRGWAIFVERPKSDRDEILSHLRLDLD